MVFPVSLFGSLWDNILGLQLQMTVIAHSPIIFIKKISQYPFFW